jgi:glycine betaine transporter
VDVRPRPGPTQLLVAFYLAAAFVCFVTSADSNTSAMASISSRGVTPENPEGALATKIAWRLLVGLAAWAMITFANVDGIRSLSNLGGLPATILVLLVLGSLAVIILGHDRLDVTGAT